MTTLAIVRRLNKRDRETATACAEVCRLLMRARKLIDAPSMKHLSAGESKLEILRHLTMHFERIEDAALAGLRGDVPMHDPRSEENRKIRRLQAKRR